MSPFHNAIKLFDSTKLNQCTLPLPSNLAFHDLTPHKSTPAEAKALLGLRGKFILMPSKTTGDIWSSLRRLLRDFCIKVIFSGDDNPLFNPNHLTSQLFVRSSWEPTFRDLPAWTLGRLERFSDRISPHFKCKRATPNLLPIQTRLLAFFKRHHTLLFPDTDKGLEPCAVTYDQYVEAALLRLQNEEIYLRLSREDALSAMHLVQEKLNSWLSRYHNIIGKQATSFIRHHMSQTSKTPFGQFYIMYKIHKGMKNEKWPTRPVCSDVSSLPHGLGKWITTMLQPIAQQQQSFFKDTFVLKDLVDDLIIPSGAQLFTCDATSMYTNICTGPAIEHISHYLRMECEKTFHHYDADALIEAIHIVFENNIVAFGDTYWKQISGTGMGISPAPPWATIYFGLFETGLLNWWATNLMFYRQFIDDVIGI
jgi:hypothetical protein